MPDRFLLLPTNTTHCHRFFVASAKPPCGNWLSKSRIERGTLRFIEIGLLGLLKPRGVWRLGRAIRSC